MLRGDEEWMQLLSEPSGGSDMAGALTRLTRDGDSYILNGSKMWSSGAAQADYGLCLARTDWDAPEASWALDHRGAAQGHTRSHHRSHPRRHRRRGPLLLGVLRRHRASRREPRGRGEPGLGRRPAAAVPRASRHCRRRPRLRARHAAAAARRVRRTRRAGAHRRRARAQRRQRRRDPSTDRRLVHRAHGVAATRTSAS